MECIDLEQHPLMGVLCFYTIATFFIDECFHGITLLIFLMFCFKFEVLDYSILMSS